MLDIFHNWGEDLKVGNGGDLALSSGSDTINQRVLRRLLTNPGDYIWNLDYGGGLGKLVGQPVNSRQIEAVISTQILQEAAIPVSPAPRIVTTVTDAAQGNVAVNITYSDPGSSNPVTLNLNVG
ncbi:MAG TPA: phage tail protein [Acetobacteraceae bacterium]|jgi:phage baseplate assembly protein W|nr:phage tail protein [Acetobacteraceae bacterium]